jgi:hypothetical protein
MMGDFNEAGLGVYSKNGYAYYTLDLGKRRSVTPSPTPTPSPTTAPKPSSTTAVTPTPDPTATPLPTPKEIPVGPTPTPSPQSANNNAFFPLGAFYLAVAIGITSIAALLVWTLKKQK